jgi:hypothetical protein
MKFNFKLSEGEWVKYNEDVEFLIRPFPNSKQPFRVSGDVSIGEYNWTVFNSCVLDWKGIEDQNNNPLKCNEINKLKLFDLNSSIPEFVFEKQKEIKARHEEELKN